MGKTWRAIEELCPRPWWEADFSWWNPTKPWWTSGPAENASLSTKLRYRMAYEYNRDHALCVLWLHAIGSVVQTGRVLQAPWAILAAGPFGQKFRELAAREFDAILSKRWTANNMPTSLLEIPLTLSQISLEGQSLS